MTRFSQWGPVCHISLQDFSTHVEPIGGLMKKGEFLTAAYQFWEAWMEGHEHLLPKTPSTKTVIHSMHHAMRLFNPEFDEVEVYAAAALESYLHDLPKEFLQHVEVKQRVDDLPVDMQQAGYL